MHVFHTGSTDHLTCCRECVSVTHIPLSCMSPMSPRAVHDSTRDTHSCRSPLWECIGVCDFLCLSAGRHLHPNTQLRFLTHFPYTVTFFPSVHAKTRTTSASFFPPCLDVGIKGFERSVCTLRKYDLNIQIQYSKCIIMWTNSHSEETMQLSWLS